MPCIRVPSGFICTRGIRRLKCQIDGCSAEHVALCDFPLQGLKAGKTCDRRMCEGHRAKVGPDRDLCPVHLAFEAGHVAAELCGFAHPDRPGITCRLPKNHPPPHKARPR